MTNPPLLEASILLVCGLPGSGKSTLIQSIVRHYQKSLSASSAAASFLLFDDIIVIDYDNIATNICQNIRDANSIITKYSNNNNDDDEGNYFTKEELQAWRMTRKEALKQLHDQLQKNLDTATAATANAIDNKRRILIILDDNFHLRSMRRDVYKVCQQFLITKNNHNHQNENKNEKPKPMPRIIDIGLVILHVNTPIEQCLENNEKRRTKNNNDHEYIPRQIIYDMDSIFELPKQDDGNNNAKSSNFESIVITIDKQLHLCNENNDKDEDDIIQFYYHLSNQLTLCTTDEYQIKLPQEQKSIEQLQKEREVTLQSKIHHIDLLLRALVGAICKADSKRFGKVANIARKDILKEQKDSCLKYMSNFINDDDDEEDRDSRQFNIADSKIVADFVDRISTDDGTNTNLAHQEILQIVTAAYNMFVDNKPSKN